MSSETAKNPVSSPKVDDLRLSNANLDRLPDAIRRPAYDRSASRPASFISELAPSTARIRLS